jgi:hypothetical protein
MSNNLRSRVARLLRMMPPPPAKIRPRIKIPGAPAFHWGAAPDPTARRLVIPSFDARCQAPDGSSRVHIADLD